jgi:hypothetical protein
MKNALLVNITPEDEKWGVSQDRWACVVVRSIQRDHPEFLYVTVDQKGIGISVPEDGDDGMRYKFDPPPEELLKSFDLEHKVPEEHRTFTVVAREKAPMKHVRRDNRVKAAKARQQTREYRVRSKSPVTRMTNRFLDAASEK